MMIRQSVTGQSVRMSMDASQTSSPKLKTSQPRLGLQPKTSVEQELSREKRMLRELQLEKKRMQD